MYYFNPKKFYGQFKNISITLQKMCINLFKLPLSLVFLIKMSILVHVLHLIHYK